MQHLIGLRQKFVTVHTAIYCRKQFDVINYVTFRWMTCGIMWLAMLQFETKLQKFIRMGIIILKIFIWGGISSDIHSENHILWLRSLFPVKLNFRPYIRRYTTPNKNFDYSYPPIHIHNYSAHISIGTEIHIIGE